MTKSLGMLALVLALAGSGCTTTERNKAVTRRAFAEILEGGRIELSRELYHPDFRNHGLTKDGDLTADMEALRAIQAAAPPDTRMRPELMVAEGDLVSVLWRASGTRNGARREFRGVTIWRFVDGRIHDEWSEFDETGMLRWLGMLPEPGQK